MFYAAYVNNWGTIKGAMPFLTKQQRDWFVEDNPKSTRSCTRAEAIRIEGRKEVESWRPCPELEYER